MLIVLTALAAAVQAPAAQPTEKDDPTICTRDSAGSEVGTHMRPKKVCMKKSDRDFIERQTKQTMQNVNNGGDDRMRSTTTAPR